MGRERVKLDDWMRPVRGGRYGGRARPVTPRDRGYMAAAVVVCALGALALLLTVRLERSAGMLGSLAGIGVLQGVQLYRSRSVGWHGSAGR